METLWPTKKEALRREAPKSLRKRAELPRPSELEEVSSSRLHEQMRKDPPKSSPDQWGCSQMGSPASSDVLVKPQHFLRAPSFLSALHLSLHKCLLGTDGSHEYLISRAIHLATDPAQNVNVS